MDTQVIIDIHLFENIITDFYSKTDRGALHRDFGLKISYLLLVKFIVSLLRSHQVYSFSNPLVNRFCRISKLSVQSIVQCHLHIAVFWGHFHQKW